MRRVLLADDSVAARKSIQAVLEMAGIEVIAVGSGDLALAKLDEVSPEMVVLDAIMPGRSGYEICAEIKQNRRFASVPVVLVTSDFEPYDQEAAEAAGADGHVVKPLDAKAIQVLKVAFAKYSPDEADTLPPDYAEPAPLKPAPALLSDPSAFITGSMRVTDLEQEAARREAAHKSQGSGSPVPDHVIEDAVATSPASARAATTEDLKADVGAIVESVAAVGAVRKTVEKGTVATVRPANCPECGTWTVSGDIFCISCGAPLLMTKDEAEAFEASRHHGPSCTECGTALIEGEIFCIGCGAVLA